MTPLIVIACLAWIPASITLLSKIILLKRIGNDVYGSDSYFHLLLTDSFRRNSHRPPDRIGEFLGSGDFALPPLLPWLTSFFERQSLERSHALVPLISKVLLTYVLGVVAGLTVYRIQGGQLMVAGMAAIAAGLLYGLSPINRSSNTSNQSDFTFSPRAPSSLLASVACITTVAGAAFRSPVLWMASVLLIALACLSSKFATQAVVFTLVLASPISAAWEQLFLLLLGILVAIGLTKGQYWCALKTQVNHLALYAVKLTHETVPHVRSIFTTLDLFRGASYAITGRISELLVLINSNVVLRGLVLYPIHLLCGFILIVYPELWIHNLWTKALASLWLASIMVFFLTSLPWLKFLGEADRYLEYVGFFPATVLFVVWLFSTQEVVSPLRLIIAMTVMSSYFLVTDAFPPPFQKVSENREGLWHVLRRLQQTGARAICVPVTDAFEVIYRSGIPCVFPLPMDHSTRHMIPKYPIPCLNIEWLRSQFSLTHVIVRRQFLTTPEVGQVVRNLRVIYNNEEHVVFALEDADLPQTVAVL